MRASARQCGPCPESSRRRWLTRTSTATLALCLPLLMIIGAGSAAENQQQSGLPGSSADALKPPLQANQVGDAEAATTTFAGGTTTPILDDFNRFDESPVSQGGAWAPRDPINGTDTFSIISNRAGTDANNNVSYRYQHYPGDVEVYASISVKPADGGAVGLVFDIREEGGYGWDSYWLTWDALAGTDTLRVEIEENNGVQNLVTTQVEMSSGDRFMARRVGTQIEGWVFQGGSWQKKLEGTHPNLVGGKVGLFGRGTALRVDDLGGGAFVEPPPAVISDPTILDDFNRTPNENPVSQGGNWAPIGITGGSGARHQSNRLQNFAQPGTSYRTAFFSGAMEASATITSLPSSNHWLSVYVGLQEAGTAGWDGYELRATTISGPDLWQIRKVVNGAPTIMTSTNFDIVIGTMLLRRLGSSLEFWWKPSAGSWERKLTAIDTAYTTGRIGVGGQKSGALDNFGGGGAADVALLGQYVPELRFGRDETYRADSAALATDLYFDDPNDQHTNFLKRPGASEPIAAADPTPATKPFDRLTLDYLSTSAQTDDFLSQPTFYLDDPVLSARLDYSQWVAENPAYRRFAYGRMIPDPGGSGEKMLQYWMFYYYNPKNTIGIGKHEGDWEWIQIRLSAANVPLTLAYSQHGHPEKCSWGAYPTQYTATGHPIAYVAFESHANYFWPGPHPYNFGGLANGVDDTWDDGDQFRETPVVVNVSNNPPRWLAQWNGWWGDSFGQVNSPKSPGVQLPWGDPWGWENDPQAVACTEPPIPPVSQALARGEASAEHVTQTSRIPPLPKILGVRVVKETKFGTAARVSYCFSSLPKDPWRTPARLQLTIENLRDSLPPLGHGWPVTKRCAVVIHPVGGIRPPYLLRYSVQSKRGTWSRRAQMRIRRS